MISHNRFSGSSLDNSTGRLALKFHGPGYSSFGGVDEHCTPAPGNICLENRTEFAVISDNVFGSSGPWPVCIGPQDRFTDSEVWDVIFERNRIHPDYGSQSSRTVDVALLLWGRYFTVRNNIIDLTGSSNYPVGMWIDQAGSEPAPVGVAVYNNTIYRSGSNATEHVGVRIDSSASDTIVINNIVSFPFATGSTVLIDDGRADLVSSHNILTTTSGLVNPNIANPLSRDYTPKENSPPDEAGSPSVSVYDDYNGKRRLQDGAYDIGTIEN